MRYQKGQSGNPAGRPKGIVTTNVRSIRNKSEDIIEDVIRQAEEGCIASQKMILDRVVPTLRSVDLPVIVSGYPAKGTLLEKAEFFVDAAGKGKIPVNQSAAMVGAIGALCKIKEIEEFEKRLSEIEKAVKEDG